MTRPSPADVVAVAAGESWRGRDGAPIIAALEAAGYTIHTAGDPNCDHSGPLIMHHGVVDNECVDCGARPVPLFPRGPADWPPPSPGSHESDPPFRNGWWTRVGLGGGLFPRPFHDVAAFNTARDWSRANATKESL